MAPIPIIPGFYQLQFGLDFPGNVLPPKPLLLTNNGPGEQLTVENPNDKGIQVWKIQPPLGENADSVYRIIIPPGDQDVVAVSQNVIKNPDQVSLIKNLQVWTFSPVSGTTDVYEVESNLYPGIVGSVPLLGVDLVSQKSDKVIIQHIPVVPNPPPRPSWRLILVDKA